MNDLEYYQWEWEKYGRIRKNIRELLTSPNVHDLEIKLLQKLADEGRTKEFQRAYSLYIKNGYEFHKQHNHRLEDEI